MYKSVDCENIEGKSACSGTKHAQTLSARDRLDLDKEMRHLLSDQIEASLHTSRSLEMNWP